MISFLVQVGLHQGSVLSLLLFILVSVELSREIRQGCPEELLNATDLELVCETRHGLKRRLKAWKVATIRVKRVESKCFADIGCITNVVVIEVN